MIAGIPDWLDTVGNTLYFVGSKLLRVKNALFFSGTGTGDGGVRVSVFRGCFGRERVTLSVMAL